VEQPYSEEDEILRYEAVKREKMRDMSERVKLNAIMYGIRCEFDRYSIDIQK